MPEQLDPRARGALHQAGQVVLLHLDGGRTLGCAIADDGSVHCDVSFPSPGRLTPEQQCWWEAATAYAAADRHRYPARRAALLALPLPDGWQAALRTAIPQLLGYLWAGIVAEGMLSGGAQRASGGAAAALDRLKIATLEAATRGLLRADQLAPSEEEATAQRLARCRDDILRLAQALYELGELDEEDIARLLGADAATPLSPLGAALGALGLLGLGGVLLDEIADSFDWFDG